MAARIFLALSALVWLPYGIYCFLSPGALAASAGVAASTPTGTTELRAMYGGLQVAIGVLAALGALRPAFSRQPLLLIACLTAGLGGARLLGLMLDGGASGYTGGALGFELGSTAVAAWLLRRG